MGCAALGVLASGLALVVSGCGGSSKAGTTTHKAAKPSPFAGVCTDAARAVIAPIAGVPASSVAAKASMSDQDVPQCVYRVPAKGLKATVIVDSGAQPYFRLERTIVEAGQQFGTVRVEAAPVAVSHLGLDASWFPTERHVMTTDGKRLITAGVHLRHSTAAQDRRLSIAIARTYLHGKDAKAANGYPSG